MTGALFGRGIGAALICLSLVACAPAIRSIPTTMARLDPATVATSLQFTAPLKISFGTGYGREIPAGTRWLAAGRLPEATVYQPIDYVFTVEGQQVHEAWLVVREGAIHGFYLAAEARYSTLEHPVTPPKGIQK